MRPPVRKNKTADPLKAFTHIPGVGKSIAQDFLDMGFTRADELIGKNPEKLYEDFCSLKGMYIDRCMLYVFRCAVYYVSEPKHETQKLDWWYWKDHTYPPQQSRP